MVHKLNELSDRDLNFLSERLKWLDNEITRYRDFEWKATSFHAAFFIAVLYAILNKKWQAQLCAYKSWLIIAITFYIVISCLQLIYIHKRLNTSRNFRSEILTKIGEEGPPKIFKFWGLWEGPGAIFPIGFLLSLIFLAISVIMLLFGMS